MSILPTRLNSPSPSHLEFAALETSISIIPLFSLPLLLGLDGPSTPYGPLHPPHRTTLPLYLALHLKSHRKCRLIPPPWIQLQNLEKTLRAEIAEPQFQSMPREWVEVAKCLLECAEDDVRESERVRGCLRELREVRESKVRDGLVGLDGIHLGIPNLSPFELLSLRPLILSAWRKLSILDPKAEERTKIEMEFLEDPRGTVERARRGVLGEREEGEEED